MSLSTGRSKLYNAMKNLRVEWDRVQEVWNDSVRHEFEEKFWNDLEQQVNAALRGTDRLSTELIKFRQDCG